MIPARKWRVRFWFPSKAYASLVLHGEVLIVKLVVSSEVLTNVLNPMWVGMGKPFHRDSIVK
jgi:hypothetical protein